MSIFSKVKVRIPRLNPIDLSFTNRLTADFGKLIPVLVQETYPGDVFRHNHSLFLQFMPLNSQLFQDFNVDVHYFFVPVRLLYEDFEKFLGGGKNGDQVFVPPYFTFSGLENVFINSPTNGTLLDFMGLPDNCISLGESDSKLKDRKWSILPWRAYWKVYDDYFRDENLCDEQLLYKTGGEISVIEYRQMRSLLNRAWHKDYFTSALPWTQKGDEVVLPLGERAPLRTDAPVNTNAGASPTFNFPTRYDADDITSNYGNFGARISPNANYLVYKPDTTTDDAWYADLRNASASSLDQLRTAEMVQEWLETNARVGTRNNEQIYGHFGVHAPDARLNRSELISWSSSPVNIGEVFSTNSSQVDGNVQAFPVSNVNSRQGSGRFKWRCKEWGYIIGILSVRPRAAYYQGIPRHLMRNDRFDYYWPEFAHLGEQAIYDWELYASKNVDPDSIFGYTPRYADLKCHQDEIHGDFRQSLNFYHDARKFASSPTLGQQFIEIRQDEDDLTRIFNNISADNNKLQVYVRHTFKSLRPMPYFGTPMFKPY